MSAAVSSASVTRCCFCSGRGCQRIFTPVDWCQ